MASTKQPNVGDTVTLHKHGQEYQARVTDVRDDGSLDVMAVSKYGHDFPQSRVNPKPSPNAAPPDENTPFWSAVAG
jgi:hypothetical protein